MAELDEVLEALETIKRYVLGDKTQSKVTSASVAVPAPATPAVKTRQVAPDEMLKMKLMLESKEWPYAVNPALICDRTLEEDKLQRAEGILDFVMDQPVAGKRFLDFGCGEGHTIKVASEQGAKTAVGYDIIRPIESTLTWEDEVDNSLITTDFSKVMALGPYDLILMYDVLDHCIDDGDDPDELYMSLTNMLEQVKSVASRNATIYLRGHPWIGRHGGHMYEQINKAFAHVVFSPEELADMGYTVPKVKRVVRPIAVYRKLFEDAGLTLLSEKIERQTVEAFFEKPVIKDRIIDLLPLAEREILGSKFPRTQMEQCSIDYILAIRS